MIGLRLMQSINIQVGLNIISVLTTCTFMFRQVCTIGPSFFKGGRLGENGQNYQISVFCSKSVFRYGGITSQISRGLASLEPPQNGGKRRGKGCVFFFVFNRKRKRKWKKYFVRNLSRIPKLFFFHSSIKTEEVLFFYIYINIYIYLYIYKKN